MFGKMMNRFYYGKSGKGDFTKEDLPETRWQLFWEMLRVRISALVKLNLIYMVAWLPVIIVIGRCISMLYSGLVNLTEMQAMTEAGEMAAETLSQNTAVFQEAIRAILMQPSAWSSAQKSRSHTCADGRTGCPECHSAHCKEACRFQGHAASAPARYCRRWRAAAH